MKKIFSKLAGLFLLLLFVTSCNNGLQSKNSNKNKKNLVTIQLSVKYDQAQKSSNPVFSDILSGLVNTNLVNPNPDFLEEERNNLKYTLNGMHNTDYEVFVSLDSPKTAEELNEESISVEAGEWTFVLTAYASSEDEDSGEEILQMLYQGETTVELKLENPVVEFYMQPIDGESNSELSLCFYVPLSDKPYHLEATVRDNGTALPQDITTIYFDYVDSVDGEEKSIDEFYDNINSIYNRKDYFTYESTGDYEVSDFNVIKTNYEYVDYIGFIIILKVPESSYTIYSVKYNYIERVMVEYNDELEEWEYEDEEKTSFLGQESVNTNNLVSTMVTLINSVKNDAKLKFNTGRITLSDFAWTEEIYNKVAALDLTQTEPAVDEYEIFFTDYSEQKMNVKLGTKWFYKANENGIMEFKAKYDNITWNFGPINISNFTYDETCNLVPVKVEYSSQYSSYYNVYNFNSETNQIELETTNDIPIMPFFSTRYFDGWYYDPEFTEVVDLSFSSGCFDEVWTSNPYYSNLISFANSTFTGKRTLYAKYKDNYNVQIVLPEGLDIEDYIVFTDNGDGTVSTNPDGFMYKDNEDNLYYIYYRNNENKLNFDYSSENTRAEIKICPAEYDSDTHTLNIYNVSGSLNLHSMNIEKEHYDLYWKDASENTYYIAYSYYLNGDWSIDPNNFADRTIVLTTEYDPKEYRITYKKYDTRDRTDRNVGSVSYRYGEDVNSIYESDIASGIPEHYEYSLYGWILGHSYYENVNDYFIRDEEDLTAFNNKYTVIKPGEEIPSEILNDNIYLWAVWSLNGTANMNLYYYDFNDKATGKKGIGYREESVDGNYQFIILTGTKVYLGYDDLNGCITNLTPDQVVIKDENGVETTGIEYEMVVTNKDTGEENTYTFSLVPNDETSYFEFTSDYVNCYVDISVKGTYYLYRNDTDKDLSSGIWGAYAFVKNEAFFQIDTPVYTEDDMVVTMTKGEGTGDYDGYAYNEFTVSSGSGKEYYYVSWYVNGHELNSDYLNGLSDTPAEIIPEWEDETHLSLRIYFPKTDSGSETYCLLNKKITVVGMIPGTDDFDSTVIYFTAKR